MKIMFINADDTSRHVSSANTAIYPNLGLLTLMSSLVNHVSRDDVGYIDGTVYGNDTIQKCIQEHASELSIVCFSVLTANYGAALSFCRQAKQINNRIVSIFGNDHFSALATRIMENQPVIDYGFYGNDVVMGFTNFVSDYMAGKLKDFMLYPGLVYRNQVQSQTSPLAILKDDASMSVLRNPENTEEYRQLPFVDYSLMDTLLPHREKYLEGQHKVYFFMKERSLKSQVIDIGRGCVKFAGPRVEEIPCNACDFCGIIPGSKPIAIQTPERAWDILKNAFNQGFNYFYITADELPLTMWGMLRRMAEQKPDWYQDLKDKPKMFGYARAEGFETQPEKIDILVNELGFNHFFIGFDGLSEISLKAMNKRSANIRNVHHDLLRQNLNALKSVVDKNCLVTAGIVVTHLGITKEIMNENFNLLQEIVEAHPKTFAALDFGPLCPIPGSQSFRYLTQPQVAEQKGKELGLQINRPYLETIKDKYLKDDCFDMNEMINDFIVGCCPDIDQKFVDEYMSKITDLAVRHQIVVGGGV